MKKKYIEPNINTQIFKTEAYLADPADPVSGIEPVPEVAVPGTTNDPFAEFAY